MKLQNKILWMGFLILIGFSGSNAFARKVNISMPSTSTTLKLTNPSTVTVNYDIKCYDMNGSQIVNQTGQSLASKAGVKITVGSIDSGKCQSSSNPISTGTDLNGKSIYLCQGSSVNYANAGSLCGAGNSLCFPTVSCGYIPSISTYCGAWLKKDTSIQISNMSGTLPPSCGAAWVALTAGNAPIYYSCGGSYHMTVDNGANYIFSTSQVADTTQYNQSICCADPVQYPSTCEVTINSTDKAASLACPDFKGGVPF